MKSKPMDADAAAAARRKGATARGKYELVDRAIAYRGVLKTWAKWVDRHVDPSKTMVFFMGMSPNHIT